MTNDNIIHLSEIAVFQGDYQVLQDTSFQMAAREFVYLIGKTGTGKTSLLKTLFGILPLRSGKGEVAGFDLRELNRNTLPLLRREVGFIFQDFVLLPDRSVEENLSFALEATGWTNQSDMFARMDEVLNWVGLKYVGQKMPHQLSGGEQQRVVIARALLNSPRLIIADEATGNLDPETAQEILELLIHLNQHTNTAILFATHNYQLMKRFPARTMRCENGGLKEIAL